MAKQKEVEAVYSCCLKWDEIQVLNGLKNDTKPFKDGLIRYSTFEGHHLPIIFHAVQKNMYMAVDKILKLTKDHYHLDFANRSPMFYTKNKRMAQLLRRHGYGLNQQDREGQTALHSATLDTKPVPKSGIEMMLSLGANPEVQNLKGETPLHLSVNMPFVTENVTAIVREVCNAFDKQPLTATAPNDAQSMHWDAYPV